MPEFIPSPAINDFIFSQATVDRVLEDLMTHGIKVSGGDRLGKTIIFAQTKKHAQYLVDRFDKLYPQYKGDFFKRIVSGDNYTQSLIDLGLIHHMQQSVFIDEPYQLIRADLIEIVIGQIQALNTELVYVKMQLQYIEKYKHNAAFVCLLEQDQSNLIKYLAPIVYMDDVDEHAKRFDNLLYGLMLAQVEESPQYKKGKKQLIEVATTLLQRATIPQVREKLTLIQTIGTDEFWDSANILNFEKVRKELRSLIKFIVDEGGKNPIYINLADEVLEIHEGKAMYEAYTFEDYILKVNRYIKKNRDNLVIYKLRNNIPLTSLDYEALEKILTVELGTAEDYQ
jgi:type I restriction enzyme, R subunit